MERNNKFLVFKKADLNKSLTDKQHLELAKITAAVLDCRAKEGRRTDKQFVVVADDWPMYEAVWSMIEKWVDGQPDMRLTPCNEPCPKCGSDDLHRRFYAKGERIKNDEYNIEPCDWTIGQCHYYEAVRDLIRHHCRCCQYDWVGKPLPKKKKA